MLSPWNKILILSHFHLKWMSSTTDLVKPSEIPFKSHYHSFISRLQDFDFWFRFYSKNLKNLFIFGIFGFIRHMNHIKGMKFILEHFRKFFNFVHKEFVNPFNFSWNLWVSISHLFQWHHIIRNSNWFWCFSPQSFSIAHVYLFDEWIMWWIVSTTMIVLLTNDYLIQLMIDIQ